MWVFATRPGHVTRTTAEVVPGAFHGFDDFLPHANTSRTFFESQCTSLRDALNPEAARE
jgi:hypothetical protein